MKMKNQKYLNMPILSQCCDYTFFNWSSASSTNRYAHFIMASKAIKFSFHFPSISIKLNSRNNYITLGITLEVVKFRTLFKYICDIKI